MTAVFVPDAHARASIAAIRSLGRAGYDVHAGSALADALGLKSRFASQTAVHPDYDSERFIGWMKDYVSRHNIRMIVPSAGVLRALEPAFDDFKALLPVSDNPDIIYGCLNKCEVVRRFMAADPTLGLMDNHPASAVLDLDRPATAGHLPPSAAGYFIKAESPRNKAGGDGHLSFAFAETPDDAVRSLEAMRSGWREALVQEACSGVQVGISVLIDEGRPLAISCVRDRHPLPHSKGTMSLRESCWIPEIAEDTIRRLAHLGWQGCAMGEYRYDADRGAFNLIEINFRFWQYLHLDLWAGMDYPRIQAEWFLEGQKSFSAPPKLGVICRDTWPGEVAHLVNEVRRQDLSAAGKLKSALMFMLRFFDPRIHQDFWFPDDRMLYWRNMMRYLFHGFHTTRKPLSDHKNLP